MADSNAVQTSFLGGEWSAASSGRTDLPDYDRAMGGCLNGLPLGEGAWTRRGGWLKGGATYTGEPAVIRPFKLPNNAPCYMEITYSGGASHLEFWVADSTKAKFVRFADDNRQVTAISSANPAQVTVGASEAWSTGDNVYLTFDNATHIGVFSGLAGSPLLITANDATHFTIQDGVSGANINGTGLGYSAGAGDRAWRVLRLNMPWTTLAAVQAVRVVKADNLALLLSPGYAPQIVYWTGATFTTSALSENSLDGPYLDALAGASQQQCSTGVVGAWANSTTFQITDGAYTFTSADVGKCLRLWHQPPAWVSSTDYSTGGFAQYYVTYNGAYWVRGDATGMPIGTQPGTSFQIFDSGKAITKTPWSPAPIAGQWNLAKITSLVSGTTVNITIANPFALPASDLNVDIWRLGVYGGSTHPTCGGYHEGRLSLGGAVPNRLDMADSDALDISKVTIAGGTVPANIFTPTDVYGNVGDANGISAVFNDADVNTIYWVEPHERGFIVGTPGGEFLIAASALNDPLAPATIQAHRVSNHKSANILPVTVGGALIYVQAAGREVTEYFPDSFGKWLPVPLNERAKHLTKTGIAEIAYQQEIPAVLWARLNNGQVIGCTYRRDSFWPASPPVYNGWHQHTHALGHTCQSLCVGPDPDGNRDCLVAIMQDPGTSVYYMEYMAPVFEETDLLPAAMHVDSAIIPAGTDGGGASITLYGLQQFASTTVKAWLGGLYFPSVAVNSSGVATIAYQSDTDGLLTAAYLKSISDAPPYGFWPNSAQIDVTISAVLTRVVVPCVVGGVFTSQGSTLRSNSTKDMKTPSGDAFGMTRRVHWFNVQVTNTIGNGTRGLKVGADTSHIYSVAFPPDSITSNYNSVTMKTGVHADIFDGDYDFDGQIIWQITDATPCTVNAIGTFESTQER